MLRPTMDTVWVDDVGAPIHPPDPANDGSRELRSQPHVRPTSTALGNTSPSSPGTHARLGRTGDRREFTSTFRAQTATRTWGALPGSRTHRPPDLWKDEPVDPLTYEGWPLSEPRDL